MKTIKFLLTSFLSFSYLVCLSQSATNTNRNNKENIYYLSLVKYADYVNKNNEKSANTSKIIYIESDFKFTDSLLTKSGDIEFKVLDNEALAEFLKKDESVILHRLFPLEYDNGKFSVSLVPFRVTYDKKSKSYNFINPGSYWIYFHFKEGKFIFEKIQDYGI